MAASTDTDLAKKYLVDDLPNAKLFGSRLHGVLHKIEVGEKLSSLTQGYLKSCNLNALLGFALGQMGRATFEIAAACEQKSRIQLHKEAAENAIAEKARKDAANDAKILAHFAAIEKDPILLRKREARELRSRFDIGFIEPEIYPRAIKLLKDLADGKRLTFKDVTWFSTEAIECWNETVQKAWHRLEAEALTIEWNESKDPWHAVNASAHWRKAHEPLRALDVTEAALCMIGQNEKHQSALFTTRGGALRDIGRLNDAKTFGLKAHELTPTDFRPCTLLGAVSMELGDIKNGHIWYLKAETLGAKRTAIDVEIRTLLIRSSKGMRDSITTYLLTQDPERFAWLRKWRVR